MPKLIEKATGQIWEIPADDLAGALGSGLYEAPAGAKVGVVDDRGNVGQTDVANLGVLQDTRGIRPETEAELRARENQTRIEREHGGVLGGAAAVAENFVDSATLGGYGAATRALLPESYTEARRERTLAHPGKSTAANVAGVVAPALLSGGAGALGSVARALPAGAASRIGGGVAARLGGGALATGAGLAAEGGVMGLGAGVQELALAEDPISLERAASSLSSNALFGAGVGAGFGIFAKAAEKGLTKAKALVDDERAGRAARDAVPDDLRGLDAKGLRAAKDAEFDRLVATQADEKAAAAASLADYRTTLKEANPWLAITEGEPAKLLNSSSKSLRNALDDPKGLAKTPHTLLKPLRHQAEALERAIASSDDITAKIAARDAKLAKELGEELLTLPDRQSTVTLQGNLARRYSAFADVKAGKAGVTVARDDATKFLGALEAGEVKGASSKALQDLGGLLEKNRALQARIEGTMVPRTELTSARLTAIQDAADTLSSGGKPGMLEQMASGSIYGAVVGALPAMGPLGPVLAPMLGAKVASKVTDLVFGRLTKASAESAARTAKAIDAIFDTGTKVLKATPPLATKTLLSVNFGATPQTSRAEPKSTPLASAFRARTDEIMAQVIAGPDGRPMMHPGARQAVADRLTGARAISPVLADRLETIAARRIEFLAAKVPKRPDVIKPHTGAAQWQPSDLEMRTFARYVAAVEDPAGVEERLAAGTVTPEDAEAYRAVYPERFAEVRQAIIERLPTLRAKLPYARRIALSIFTGVPVDPALEPRILRQLQATYITEEGSEGGTQAPKPKPQFGSVERPKGTPAQERYR